MKRIKQSDPNYQKYYSSKTLIAEFITFLFNFKVVLACFEMF